MKFCHSLEGPRKVASHVPQTGPLLRELPVSTAFFYMSLEFLNKIFLNKRNFAIVSKALGK